MGPEHARLRPAAGPASLVVVDPNGQRKRVPIDPLPFLIGRQPDNHLILRDSRVSRTHARIVVEGGEYVLEDCGSRHGTFVNGKRVTRQVLDNSDRIEFGAQDSYQLIFALDGAELKRLMEQVGGADKAAPPRGGRQPRQAARHPGPGAHAAELVLDRRGAGQRGGHRAGHHRRGARLPAAARGGAPPGDEGGAQPRAGSNLRETICACRAQVIHRALEHRRELLSMNFDPLGADDTRPQNSIADLELRSVICVPLVRIRAGQSDATSVLSTGNETVGVLYMDSRLIAADLAGGNRELLQTLAIEASTVLENARLLQEERGQAADGGGTAAGADHPAEPAAGQVCRRMAGCARAAAAWRRTRWAATTST